MAKTGPNWYQGVVRVRDIIFVILGFGITVYALWAILSRISNVVLVLMMAVVFEVTLGPLVERLALRWARPWAVLVVVLTAVLVVVLGGAVLGTIMTTQIAALVGKLPEEFHRVATLKPGVQSWVDHLGIHFNLAQMESRIFSSVGQVSTFVVTQTVRFVTHLINGVVDGAITLFITVYLLLDAERIQIAVLRLIPQQNRDALLAVENTLSRVIGGYVRGQISLSLIVGGAFGIGCWVIGLPYPLVIGVFAAVMELIPLLGPVLGTVMPLVMALFSHPWVQIPELLILLAAVHLMESQVLGPRIIRSQVGLHPVLSVVALMIGAELQGVWGALFAVPVAGIVVAAWVAGVKVWREKVVLPSQEPPVPELSSPRTGIHHGTDQ